MKRILETEIMNDRQQAEAYANGNFTATNQRYVEHLIREFSSYLQNVIDVGCGPADVCMRLARAYPRVRIAAIDASPEMIRIAGEAVRLSGIDGQITLSQGYIPGFSTEERYDAVISKDMLHHLPNPMVLWNEIRTLARRNAAVYVMDLIRPDTPEEARSIVETIAADEDPILKQDFYSSLCAAFTIQEIEEQLRETGLDLQVNRVSRKHMIIKGII